MVKFCYVVMSETWNGDVYVTELKKVFLKEQHAKAYAESLQVGNRICDVKYFVEETTLED